jgi:thiol-disulfide isomerase/thioredoxin
MCVARAEAIINKSMAVIASVVRQSSRYAKSIDSGSPRRCAPRDDGLKRLSKLLLSVLTGLWLSIAPAIAAEPPPLTHGLTAVPPGQPAPALKLVDIDGKAHDLAALKGKVVVVNFWATWCPPCRREMPALERLRLALPDVVVLAVDVGEDADTVFAFSGTQEPAPEFALLLDQDSAAMQAWRVKGLPSTFVVAPDGSLAYRAVGGREFDHPEVLAQLRRLTGKKE